MEFDGVDGRPALDLGSLAPCHQQDNKSNFKKREMSMIQRSSKDPKHYWQPLEVATVHITRYSSSSTAIILLQPFAFFPTITLVIRHSSLHPPPSTIHPPSITDHRTSSFLHPSHVLHSNISPTSIAGILHHLISGS
jgi:hypothetical protein